MTTKTKGELTEGIILAALLRCGYSVALPFGDNQRYDLIVDDGKRLLRAQCKTGQLRKGRINFKTVSMNGRSGVRRSYHGQADIFLVYCPDNEKVYRIPVRLSGRSMLTLRIAPLGRGASPSAINWARRFD